MAIRIPSLRNLHFLKDVGKIRGLSSMPRCNSLDQGGLNICSRQSILSGITASPRRPATLSNSPFTVHSHLFKLDFSFSFFLYYDNCWPGAFSNPNVEIQDDEIFSFSSSANVILSYR